MGSISTSFAFETHQIMEKESIKLSFSGEFTAELITVLLLMAKSNIGGRSVMKKVYNIMIECLENLTRHGCSSNEDPAIFLLGKNMDSYYIATGNKIPNKEVATLEGRLKKVNELDREALWSWYNEVLVNGEINDKGGAGLGIIDIGIKSGEKLGYNFTKIDDQYSFFEFKVEVKV